MKSARERRGGLMPARRITLLPLLALLIACPDDGPSVNDAGTVTPVDDAGVVVVPDAGSAIPEDAGPAPVQIQEVSPVSGSAMGGTRVRVQGVGFAPDSIVLVGGEPGLICCSPTNGSLRLGHLLDPRPCGYRRSKQFGDCDQ